MKLKIPLFQAHFYNEKQNGKELGRNTAWNNGIFNLIFRSSLSENSFLFLPNSCQSCFSVFVVIVVFFVIFGSEVVSRSYKKHSTLLNAKIERNITTECSSHITLASFVIQWESFLSVASHLSFGPRQANLVLIAYGSLIQAVSQEEPSDRKPDP